MSHGRPLDVSRRNFDRILKEIERLVARTGELYERHPFSRYEWLNAASSLEAAHLQYERMLASAHKKAIRMDWRPRPDRR